MNMVENVSSYASHLLVVALGAALHEIIHWYGLRQKLHLKKNQKILRSPLYWCITAGMILVTPIAVILWFSETLDVLPYRDLLIFGAAFPALFKSVADKVASSGSVKLGQTERSEESVDDAEKITLSDYLSGR